MISILFPDKFDANVVNNKGESDVTRHMFPEGGGAGDRHISKLGEVDFQPVIGDATSLF